MDIPVEELLYKLKLTNEKEVLVVLDEADTQAMAAKSRLCLLGKVLVKQAVKVEAMKAALVPVWRLPKGVTITVLGENLFFFQFLHAVDKQLGHGDKECEDRLMADVFDTICNLSYGVWLYVAYPKRGVTVMDRGDDDGDTQCTTSSREHNNGRHSVTKVEPPAYVKSKPNSDMLCLVLEG
ncbi:hypothetical protein LOK49_LG02G01399 [Camellia lanceoleosa]|uniref:Uncharacterized protein n=1 Tax=Camellia lanceoleosa TaxID=1840588 RepID=A0ACC0ILS8_9ERIC|nr:hypothetical protein LOK49_LG02G01399 [Camellia lanceoleosa]